MGGESFSKMVWPKTLKVYIWCAFGVASNGKSVKCWCGNSEVGVATAIPAIRRAPPMRVIDVPKRVRVLKPEESMQSSNVPPWRYPIFGSRAQPWIMQGAQE